MEMLAGMDLLRVEPTCVQAMPSSRSHPPSDLVASDWAGFPRWGGELRACLTERTGFYDPYAAFAYPGVDRVRTSRPFGFAAAGAGRSGVAVPRTGADAGQSVERGLDDQFATAVERRSLPARSERRPGAGGPGAGRWRRPGRR